MYWKFRRAENLASCLEKTDYLTTIRRLGVITLPG